MKRLRVLLVPDWLEWVTGTIARDIARYNPWISATILSGPVLRRLTAANPALIERFDLVHFLCPYASGDWLPLLRGTTPVVTRTSMLRTGPRSRTTSRATRYSRCRPNG
jgi:hypothetical protein